MPINRSDRQPCCTACVCYPPKRSIGCCAHRAKIVASLSRRKLTRAPLLPTSSYYIVGGGVMEVSHTFAAMVAALNRRKLTRAPRAAMQSSPAAMYTRSVRVCWICMYICMHVCMYVCVCVCVCVHACVYEEMCIHTSQCTTDTHAHIIHLRALVPKSLLLPAPIT